MNRLKCTEFDALLCDYLDGVADAGQRAMAEAHIAECGECADLARDARAALAFVERTEEVDVPQQLVTQILYQIPTKMSGRLSVRTGVRGWVNRLLEPVLQPRYVMGAMLTILSLAMMTRCAGAPDHPLNASDLDPVRLWTALDDRVHRSWERTVKTYESMRLVYEVQTRLREWKSQQPEDEAGVAENSAAVKNQAGSQQDSSKNDSRRLPLRTPQAGGAAAASSGNTSGAAPRSTR